MAEFIRGILPRAFEDATDEDRQLISAAKEDVEAFGKLYDKYYGVIVSYVYHRTLDRTVAEDLTANTFLSAFTHIGRFRWRGIPFSAWLYRIAINEIRMYYRKRGKSPTIRLVTDDQPELHMISSLPLADPSAVEMLITDEQRAWVHRAILRLKPIYQTVITLRFFDQKPTLR